MKIKNIMTLIVCGLFIASAAEAHKLPPEASSNAQEVMEGHHNKSEHSKSDDANGAEDHSESHKQDGDSTSGNE